MHKECVYALMFVGVNIVQVMKGYGYAEFILFSSDELLGFGAGIEDEELRFTSFVRADESVNDNEPEEFFRFGKRVTAVEDEPVNVKFIMFSREFEIA